MDVDDNNDEKDLDSQNIARKDARKSLLLEQAKRPVHNVTAFTLILSLCFALEMSKLLFGHDLSGDSMVVYVVIILTSVHVAQSSDKRIDALIELLGEEQLQQKK